MNKAQTVELIVSVLENFIEVMNKAPTAGKFIIPSRDKHRALVAEFVDKHWQADPVKDELLAACKKALYEITGGSDRECGDPACVACQLMRAIEKAEAQ